jgi:hypothetical protein
MEDLGSSELLEALPRFDLTAPRRQDPDLRPVRIAPAIPLVDCAGFTGIGLRALASTPWCRSPRSLNACPSDLSEQIPATQGYLRDGIRSEDSAVQRDGAVAGVNLYGQHLRVMDQ